MKILYFAQASQQAGCREENWAVTTPLSIESFWEELENHHPGMNALRTSCRLACNCNYIGPSDFIQPDDEVAIIPPVSGG